MLPISAYDPQRDRRQAPRHVGLRREVLLESPVFYENVMLIDIGRRGFSVQTLIAYQSGSRLRLCIGDGQPIEAVAVWHAKNRLGARFVEPLEEELLLSLTGED
jgi:hypothetical protein